MKTNKRWGIMMMLTFMLSCTVVLTSCGKDDDDNTVTPSGTGNGGDSNDGGSSNNNLSVIGNTYSLYYEGGIDKDRRYSYNLTLYFQNSSQCVIKKNGYFSKYVSFQGYRNTWEDTSATAKYSRSGKTITIHDCDPRTYFKEEFDSWDWTLTVESDKYLEDDGSNTWYKN